MFHPQRICMCAIGKACNLSFSIEKTEKLDAVIVQKNLGLWVQKFNRSAEKSGQQRPD